MNNDFSITQNKIPVSKPLEPSKKKKGEEKKGEAIDSVAKKNMAVRAFAGVKAIAAKIKKGEKEPIEKEKEVHQGEIPIEGETQLKDLPQEVVLHVLGFVPGTPEKKAQTLANFSQTNKEYHELANDPTLWKESIGKTKVEMKKDVEKESVKRAAYESVRKTYIDKKEPDLGFLEEAFLYEQNPKLKQKLYNQILDLLVETLHTDNSSISYKRAIKLTNDALDAWGKDLKVSPKQEKALEKWVAFFVEFEATEKETDALNKLLERIRK